MNHILVVEDDNRINSFMVKGLKAAGYGVSVLDRAHGVLEAVSEKKPDLLLLDLGLPDMDGMDLLKELRGQGHTMPVIIVTARDELDDRITGLDQGANDYIIKPFRFSELLARIRVQLRQSVVSQATAAPASHLVEGPGGLRLDLRSHRVMLEPGIVVDLSTKEFMILELLIKHAERPLSRAEILEHTWGYNHDPGSNVVDVYIGYLRRKIGFERIVTIRGVGYQLIAL
jgi:DNA-binding response OmpR family regulator